MPAVLGQPVPPATTSMPAQQDGVAAPPAQRDPCSRQVVIYIDLSGTMTRPAPDQRNATLVPLNFIASTLLKFVSNPQFIRGSDEIALKFFGTYVATKGETREDVTALLQQLAGSGTWQSAIANDRGTFVKKTDFGRAFADVASRVSNSTAAQQIIFIASDFAEDPIRLPGAAAAADRIRSFEEALQPIAPLLGSSSASKVQVVGIAAPTPVGETDRTVAAQVRELLRQRGVRTYDFNEDADEAARTLWNAFVTPIHAAPADGNVVRVGADQSITIRLQNDNCAEVQINGLQFRGASRVVEQTFSEPVRLSNGKTNTRVTTEKLIPLWNSDVEVVPLLAAGSAARTQPSARFWLGDWVRVSRPSARAYPRIFTAGDLLVSAAVERSLRGPTLLSIRGGESDGRAREFEIEPGYTTQPATFRFRMESGTGDTWRSGLPLTISANGARLVESDASPLPEITLPVSTPLSSTVGKFIEGHQTASLFILIYLVIAIFARRAAEDRDEKTRDAMSSVLRRLASLLLPAAGTFLLSVKFGHLWFADWSLVGVALLIRALLAAAVTHLLLSQCFFQGGLWRLFEPKLLDNEDAVFRRTFARIVVWSATAVVFIVFVSDFFRASAPPWASRLLAGALR
ncbi:MAG TPA: hypothetical protein VGF48_10685 [Thermoanaerobaculia bacterium]